MKTQNSRVLEYIAYLILVRSMLKNSDSTLLSPNEERILNYLAIDLFADQKICIKDAFNLIPGLDIESIKEGIVSLNQKGFIKISNNIFFDKESSKNEVSLTELSKQYLLNMGRCLFHATSEMLEYE
jgi:hypothetical protein